MSLFKSLFPLARENSLTVLIVAEGEQLRVNVMPKSKDEKASKTLYPLSLLGAPDELDRDFAEAVQIYAPGAQSVLEQAQAASEANGGKKAPALPAPAKEKGKAAKKAKANASEPAGDGVTDDADAPSAGAPVEVDPRQTQIPGLSASEDEPSDVGEEGPAASSEPEDAGVDLL
jgi:PRTRC genetic system protein E